VLLLLLLRKGHILASFFKDTGRRMSLLTRHAMAPTLCRRDLLHRGLPKRRRHGPPKRRDVLRRQGTSNVLLKGLLGCPRRRGPNHRPALSRLLSRGPDSSWDLGCSLRLGRDLPVVATVVAVVGHDLLNMLLMTC